MKEYKAIDLETARKILITSCEKDIEVNTNRFWAGLFGNTLITNRRDLIKKLDSAGSIAELTNLVGENSTPDLINLIVLQIYQTPEAAIRQQEQVIRRKELEAGYGRYGSASILPRGSAINHFFKQYLQNAKVNMRGIELQ